MKKFRTIALVVSLIIFVSSVSALKPIYVNRMLNKSYYAAIMKVF